MTTSRKLMSLIFTMIVLASLVVTVFADSAGTSSGKAASPYAPVNYSTHYANGALTSNLSVRANPDHAKLTIVHDVYAADYMYGAETGHSSFGATSYQFEQPLRVLAPFPPEYAYITYKIEGGSLYES